MSSREVTKYVEFPSVETSVTNLTPMQWQKCEHFMITLKTFFINPYQIKFKLLKSKNCKLSTRIEG